MLMLSEIPIVPQFTIIDPFQIVLSPSFEKIAISVDFASGNIEENQIASF